MIHVVAVITAHPGQRAKILEAFLANTDAVRADVVARIAERGLARGERYTT